MLARGIAWRRGVVVVVIVAIVVLGVVQSQGGRERRQAPWRGLPPGLRGRGGALRGGLPPGLARRQGPAGPSGSPETDGGRQQEDGSACTPSPTTINGGQRVCGGQLVFEDHFNDLHQWTNDVHMAGAPDYEFAVFKNSPWNIFIEHGIMTIKAFLSEDKYGAGFVSNGTMVVKRCTSSDPDLCKRTAFSYNILPPVRSARVHTANSFSFRYGVVEMRVRGPRGDWLYPQLSLKPAQSSYGPYYSSGEIRLPTHVGNKFLRAQGQGGRGWRGRKLMVGGVALGLKGENDAHVLTAEGRAPPDVGDWAKVFHVVRLKWTPDDFEFWVDGEFLGRGKIPVPRPGGFASLTDSPSDHPWAAGEENAPFDQEFYLSIGLGVGGLNRFPDNVTNGQNEEFPKPWKNTSPKAMLNFWKAKDQWYSTWHSPHLQVSYAKVWAL